MLYHFLLSPQPQFCFLRLVFPFAFNLICEGKIGLIICLHVFSCSVTCAYVLDYSRNYTLSASAGEGYKLHFTNTFWTD